MQIVFTAFNHNEIGRRSLEDVIGIMGQQLRALGHYAVYEPTNDRLVTADSGINIIVEGFTPPVVKVMAAAKEKGARFVILATEEPTPKGFNWGTQKDMIARQEVFPEAAKYCDGILHLVPGQHITDWFSQFAPAAPAELGYAPSLVRGTRIEPDYEFGFYGSMTPRRRSILTRLARRLGRILAIPNAVRICSDFKAQEERDADMQRAKVIVQVRKFESMGLVSSSRCSTALCLGRPVVPEPHTLVEPWNEVLSFPETLDGFYDRCLLVRNFWKEIHAQQMARFKEKMSPMRCVGKALAQIGILDGEGRELPRSIAA